MSEDREIVREAIIQPWERQPGETSAAYYAFTLYRDLGPERSIDRAFLVWRNQGGKKTESEVANGTWRDWSTENQWARRSDAWDMHLDAIRRAEIERTHAQLNDEFINRCRSVAVELTERGQQGLLWSQKALQKALEGSFDNVTPSQIASMLTAAGKLVQMGLDAEAAALAVESLLKEKADGNLSVPGGNVVPSSSYARSAEREKVA